VDILIKDNYFENPDYMRELGLSNSTYRINNDLHGPGGWKGKRTKPFHDSIVAGVVYLTPDAPSTAGTSILDANKNQFVNVENKYNRLIAYEASVIHGISELFGNSDDTGRLTFTFFIHDIESTATHN